MTSTRYIYPEDYLTPEMAKLARALGFVDDRPIRAFTVQEMRDIRTAGARMHYEVLGRGCSKIAKIYGCSDVSMFYRLRHRVRMRPQQGWLRVWKAQQEADRQREVAVADIAA